VSTPGSSPLPANVEQQRKLAKDLIRAARDGDPAALARIRAVRSDAGARARALTLADAQLAVAREAGFESWPTLVAALQEGDVQAFCGAVRDGDVPRAKRLLELMHVRKRINDPMFDFGQRAAHIAARNEPSHSSSPTTAAMAVPVNAGVLGPRAISVAVIVFGSIVATAYPIG
jgi:hypothetical protein